jgi:hypothetical protein
MSGFDNFATTTAAAGSNASAASFDYFDNFGSLPPSADTNRRQATPQQGQPFTQFGQPLTSQPVDTASALPFSAASGDIQFGQRLPVVQADSRLQAPSPNAQPQANDAAVAAMKENIFPGITASQQADSILKNTSLSSADRFHQAQPLLEQAYNAGRTINVSQNLQSLQSLTAQIKTMQNQGNPAALAQMQSEMQVLQAQVQYASVPTLNYAIALNHYAVENPGARDSADANTKAIALIKEIQATNPVAGTSPGVAGALIQAQKNPPEAMDQTKAIALGAVDAASRQSTEMLGPTGGLDPWTVISMPVLRRLPLLPFGQMYDVPRDQGALTLAQGLQAAPDATQKAVDDKVRGFKSMAVDTLGSLGSGFVGLTVANLSRTAIQNLAPDLPGPLKFAGMLAAGYLATLGTKEGVDYLGHYTLGTDINSLKSNALKSAFTFGAFEAMSALNEVKAGVQAGSLGADTQITTVDGVTGTTKAGILKLAEAEKINVTQLSGFSKMSTAQQIQAIQSELGSKVALRGMIDQLGISSNPATWTQSDLVLLQRAGFDLNALGSALRANPSIFETSVTAGVPSRAYLNPSNWFRTWSSLDTAPTLADFSARMKLSNFVANVGIGAGFSGIFGMQYHTPGVSINEATGKPYTFSESLVATGKDAALGGAVSGTLPVVLNLPPLSWMGKGANFAISKISPEATKFTQPLLNSAFGTSVISPIAAEMAPILPSATSAGAYWGTSGVADWQRAGALRAIDARAHQLLAQAQAQVQAEQQPATASH